jgi:hypothetical protein
MPPVVPAGHECLRRTSRPIAAWKRRLELAGPVCAYVIDRTSASSERPAAVRCRHLQGGGTTPRQKEQRAAATHVIASTLISISGPSQIGGNMSFIRAQDGSEIFYKDWGKGQPVVFSHGWPLSSDDWDAQTLFFRILPAAAK